MQVSSIQLSGNENTLRWCVANRAELKDNLPMISIINDDTFFLIRLTGIDFYQMFRLTQLYRNRLKICGIDRAATPSASVLADYFPGNADKVENLLNMFTGIVSQMLADSDIIYPGIPKLFLPMIVTKFTVQIPFSFVDAIEVMTEEEVSELFTGDYHANLEAIIDKGASHSLIRSAMIAVERSTANIRYNQKYEQLLQLTKYFSLKDKPGRTQPYKTGLVSFSKFDPISRGSVQISMFKPDETTVADVMRRLKTINSPMEFSFAIQLPIYHMQMLEGQYFQDDLTISHRSSINSIVDNGINLTELHVGDASEAIDNYRVRLTEAQFATLKVISDITSSTADFHPSAMFALLPPVYQTNAVITFSEDKLGMLSPNDDPVIHAMFEEISVTVNSILLDMKR